MFHGTCVISPTSLCRGVPVRTPHPHAPARCLPRAARRRRSPPRGRTRAEPEGVVIVHIAFYFQYCPHRTNLSPSSRPDVSSVHPRQTCQGVQHIGFRQRVVADVRVLVEPDAQVGRVDVEALRLKDASGVTESAVTMLVPL